MKTYFHFSICIFLAYSVINLGCTDTPDLIKSEYHFIEPTYKTIQLLPQNDTLNFPLAEKSYNVIGSFNYFTDNGKPFISFFDRDGKAIITYDFISRQLVHKVPLKKWFVDQNFKKASTYVVNFDSIFIITANKLILVDSSSIIKKSIDLFDDPNRKPYSDNETPLVLKDLKLFSGMLPVVAQGSIKSHREFRVLCRIDLLNDAKELCYQLPEIYLENLYGYSFLEYSYCMNAKGNFVFSFPADTNIYESNLIDYYKSYFGKSRFQTGVIQPVSKEIIENGDSRKEYYTRDSYGTIYFDPYQRRYLRLARQKINESDYLAKNKIRKRSFIFMDEDLKIIGESEFDDNFDYRSIFFTPYGMYTRVKANDEQALHFVHLNYSDQQSKPIQLSKNKE